jgi:hypothetical protein
LHSSGNYACGIQKTKCGRQKDFINIFEHGTLFLVGRPEGRRPLGRPRRRWEDNIKMDLREIGFGDVD